jgi:hypothetical protein
MKRLACAVMLVSLALTGCGNSVCEDMADAFEDFDEKAKPCDDGSEPSDPITDAEIEQCDKDLESCSDSDKDAIRDFADCLADVPTCSPSNQDAFASASLACFFSVSGKISPNCGAIDISESIGRDAASRLTSHY